MFVRGSKQRRVHYKAFVYVSFKGGLGQQVIETRVIDTWVKAITYSLIILI